MTPIAECGFDYYERVGTLDSNGEMSDAVEARYRSELLARVPRATRLSAKCLEVGCGCSPYVSMLVGRGYGYSCLDSSGWALTWTANRWGSLVENKWLADAETQEFDVLEFDLVFAAHVLEHAQDAPGLLRRARSWLRPGGYIYLIVPDDMDRRHGPDQPGPPVVLHT
jgi:trans-aconitate methyltransferase